MAAGTRVRFLNISRKKEINIKLLIYSLIFEIDIFFCVNKTQEKHNIILFKICMKIILYNFTTNKINKLNMHLILRAEL